VKDVVRFEIGVVDCNCCCSSLGSCCCVDVLCAAVMADVIVHCCLGE